MVLLDDGRSVADVNNAFLSLSGYRRNQLMGQSVHTVVAGGPLLTGEQWANAIGRDEFHGEVGLICADGTVVVHQWGATIAVVTGRRLVLMVMLSSSKWGGRFRRQLPEEQPVGEMSEREREVVQMVAMGRTGPEIAEGLGIAHDTVRTHVRNAMNKVGARSRAHLVAKALGEGHALPT